VILSMGILTQAMSQLVMLMALLFEFKIIFLVSVFLFILCFAIAIGGIMFLYQVEILPSELVPVVTVFLFLSAAVISQITLPLISMFGVFPIFVFINFVTFFTWFYVEGNAVETKGKSKDEIEVDFFNKRFYVYE
jgi:fatty acid desaturase